MSKLLIQENPLILLPTLAKEIGLHEAIILQQLHYWINHHGPDGRRYGKVVDGVRYIRNSVVQWHESNFPFLSKPQIYRTLKNLEDNGFVLSRKDLNQASYDRTKWYTIDYPVLHQCEMEIAQVKNPIHAGEDTIPETTTETTKENNNVIVFGDITKLYASMRGGHISQFDSDHLGEMVDDWKIILEELPEGNVDKNYSPEEVVYNAVKIMGANAERKSLRYVERILENWQIGGIQVSKKNEETVGNISQSVQGTYV